MNCQIDRQRLVKIDEKQTDTLGIGINRTTCRCTLADLNDAAILFFEGVFKKNI